MQFINIFISFFPILFTLLAIPIFFFLINKINVLSFKFRKIALYLHLEKNELYLVLKNIIYLIIGIIYICLIYFSNNFLEINYSYFVFKKEDLLYLSFFILGPLVSVGIFIWFRIFDRKTKFYLSILSKNHFDFKKIIFISYFLETLDHCFSYIVWILVLPILISIYDTDLNFHVIVLICNICLIINFVFSELFKANKKNYQIFQNHESTIKIRIVKVIIWLNVFLVNMFLSNFQFNIVIILLVVFWTKFTTRFLFLKQYAYTPNIKIF